MAQAFPVTRDEAAWRKPSGDALGQSDEAEWRKPSGNSLGQSDEAGWRERFR
jgi:hypothetical protein